VAGISAICQATVLFSMAYGLKRSDVLSSHHVGDQRDRDGQHGAQIWVFVKTVNS